MFFRWYLTSKAQGPSQTSSCGIWGDQSDTDTFFSNDLVFPFSIILLQLSQNIPADVGFLRYKTTVYIVAKKKVALTKATTERILTNSTGIYHSLHKGLAS